MSEPDVKFLQRQEETAFKALLTHGITRSMSSGYVAEGIKILGNKLVVTEGKLKVATRALLDHRGEFCRWYLADPEHNVYKSRNCKAEWQLINGGPKDNGINFCPECGRMVTVEITVGDTVGNVH